MKKNTLLFALLPWLLALPNTPAQSAADKPFARWGRETLQTIEHDHRRDNRPGYYEGQDREDVAFAWGNAILLLAYAQAARCDQTYDQPLDRLLQHIESYYVVHDGIGGYDSLPHPRENVDRYYDDNAWIAMGMIDAFHAVGKKEYLRAADRALDFSLSGIDKEDGGIWWREHWEHEWHQSKNTCSVAPTAFACLRYYEITRDKTYLDTARKLMDWLDAHLQDDDGLYFDSIRTTGRIGRRKWSYNSAMPMRCYILLHKHTGRQNDLNKALRIARAAEDRWYNAATGAIACESMFAFTLVEGWLELTAATGETRWRNLAESAMTYVHDHVKDPRGRYCKRWDVANTEPISHWKLLFPAAAGRAYWALACPDRNQNNSSPPAATTPAPFYGEIKPLAAGDTLYVYSVNPRRDPGRAVAMQTLQGIVARTDRPHVWIDVGDNTFLDNLADNYGIRVDRQYAENFPALLAALKPYTSGRYVLYDRGDRPSITAATTMAGVLDAVAIDTRLENIAVAQGYSRALDVRGKDCRWVYENYRDQLNDTALTVHTNNVRHHPSAFHFRDWSPATRTLDWWHEDEALSRQVYRDLAPCSPVYGWQDAATSDEGNFIKMHSAAGLFQIPSDWMVNLSVHAAMGPALKDKTFTQKVTREIPLREDGVHYVTFIMSDMDNILTEIGTRSFFSLRKFYANPHRGKFPMSWGMAPALAELSPTGVELWYKNATPNDVFVAYCGLGYFYPSIFPHMQAHVDRLAGLLERTDLRTLLIIDRLLPDIDLTDDYARQAKWFTALAQIRGLFYLEYVKYAPHEGRIFWFDNKPMVTARFDFREERFYPAVRSSAASLAESLNALPKNPASPSGYSFVTVHAWSQGMDDIYETVQLLDPDVRVVDAETFIELLHLNLKPPQK